MSEIQQEDDAVAAADKSDDIRHSIGMASEWTLNTSGRCSGGTTIGDENASKQSESNLKIALLEAKLQMLEAANRHVEEKIKLLEERQIQERKYTELETKMHNIELGQRMSQFETDFAKKLAILQEQQKANFNLVKEENVALLEKLKGAEAKAQMANRQLELAMQEIQHKMEEMARRNDEKLIKQQQEMEEKNEFLMKMLKDAEEKTKSLENKTIEQFKKILPLIEFHKYQQQMDEFKAENRAEMEELAKQMANQKEQWAIQMKPEILWATLAKGKRLANPHGNSWNGTKARMVTISADGLSANADGTDSNSFHYVYAEQAFGITGDACRKDNFPGIIVQYFEVSKMSSSKWSICVGLSNGNIPAESKCVFAPSPKRVFAAPNSYAFPSTHTYCWLSGGNKHQFEWPTGAIKPKWNRERPNDVVGCGILLSLDNKLAIFFTGNGILMGKQIQISPTTVDHLYPTVCIQGNDSMEANFGDNSAKPFKYDIHRCPGLVLDGK